MLILHSIYILVHRSVVSVEEQMTHSSINWFISLVVITRIRHRCLVVFVLITFFVCLLF